MSLFALLRLNLESLEAIMFHHHFDSLPTHACCLHKSRQTTHVCVSCLPSRKWFSLRVKVSTSSEITTVYSKDEAPQAICLLRGLVDRIARIRDAEPQSKEPTGHPVYKPHGRVTHVSREGVFLTRALSRWFEPQWLQVPVTVQVEVPCLVLSPAQHGAA